MNDLGTVDLSSYNNDHYSPGGNTLVRLLWAIVNVVVFQNPAFPFIGVKVWLLRCFGARLGQGVVIKPSVSIKYPWHLTIGNHCWIGEGVWIDNLTTVVLGDHVCISQGAMLLTGNHDYKRRDFSLVVGEIHLEDGCWIGARSTVCPGVRCSSHSVLAVQSVATHDLDAHMIYQGNPAVSVRQRHIVSENPATAAADKEPKS